MTRSGWRIGEGEGGSSRKEPQGAHRGKKSHRRPKVRDRSVKQKRGMEGAGQEGKGEENGPGFD